MWLVSLRILSTTRRKYSSSVLYVWIFWIYFLKSSPLSRDVTSRKTFSFFKESENLERITPGFLKFKILNQSTPEIQEGTKINYQLSLHGLPVTWQSQITVWNPNAVFSDMQTKGPYSHWSHTHQFEEKNGGTLIKDRVLYKIPFGLFGDLVAGKWIKKDLEAVFNYRYKTIDTLMAH